MRKQKEVAGTQNNGVSFETGPNAILLSDTPIQKGQFSNLAAFPLLPMLYPQGMLIPGHPPGARRAAASRRLLRGGEDLPDPAVHVLCLGGQEQTGFHVPGDGLAAPE